MKKSTGNFDKFANKVKPSVIKEQKRQEKRKDRKEAEAAINKRFEEKRRMRADAPPAADKGGKRAEIRTDRREKVQKEIPVKPGRAIKPTASEKSQTTAAVAGKMPLNKYIAHSGVCSRRDAAALVKDGKVTVNGKPATDPGYKVEEGDVVKVNGKKVVPSRNFVYILLNKPKDYITTLEDPQGRKTVLDLIKTATEERVYPIGRLDRNTSGILLLTNDGDLAQTLSHPKFEIKKVYHVGLDKPLTKNDFDRIMEGVQLEDGVARVDALAYTDPKDKTQVGLEIHSGRNRIVRRIFEHLKYDVKTLDRVMYAGLTKKNVPRGKWRFLSEKEVRILKHFNSTKKTKAANARNIPQD